MDGSEPRPAPAAPAIRCFDARAAGYESHARLQRLCAARLAEFIRETGGLPEGPIVEIGCGTGLLTRLLTDGRRRVLATDLAPQMLRRCRENLCAMRGIGFARIDGEYAAFTTPPAAIVSSLAAQWFTDPAAGLARLARQTRVLAFAVPAAGSFPEWEDAFRVIGRKSGLFELPRIEKLLATLGALPGAGLRYSSEVHALHYATGRDFIESFRGTGASQPSPGYRPAPIRAVLRRFASGMDASARILYCRIDWEGK